MQCDECANKATVHLTEIINGQVTKLNLCEACAKKKGTGVEQNFGIADLLSALSDVGQPLKKAGQPAPKNKCARCGLTYEDFKKIGRLGCSECYNSFHASLQPLLKRIHGSARHLGKVPGHNPSAAVDTVSRAEKDLQAAKAELQKAVRQEEYERAATLRDKVRSLEKKLKKGTRA